MGSPSQIAFEIAFEGNAYKGVVDEETIATFEDTTDRSVVEIMGVDGRPPKFSLLGAFLAAALSRNHPDVTRIDGMRMLREPGVQEKMLGGLVSAMPQGGDVADDDDDGEAGGTPTANPPAKKRDGKKGGKTAS